MRLPQDSSFYSKCQISMNQTHIVISPTDSINILIDRNNLEVSHQNIITSANNQDRIYLGEIFGIIGIKHLVKRSYLLAVNAATLVNSSKCVYKIDSIAIFPIQDVPSIQESYRDRVEWQWEEIYLKMISDLFKACNFYFSSSYDLTNSLQTNFDIVDNLIIDDPYRYSNPRFQWNYNLLEPFDIHDRIITKCRLPIIMGFVAERYLDKAESYRWLLISRRGTRRAGTRFNRRGVDDEGNVANFVETEQVLEALGHESAFLQIRGSIPMYWSQNPTYRYKPAIEIQQRDHESAMMKHYREMKEIYGELSVACLIDQKGHEAQLAREFNMRMASIKTRMTVSYHYFDFHKECGKMRWHRLSLLLEKLKPELESYGFFSTSSKICFALSRQMGVVRSNCIDSLDRTNVVQSMIAQYMLNIQLRTLHQVSLSDYPEFTQAFKDVWADNADALSIQYAGTPALKTDFTRTGKRTYPGILRDGLNSVTRYVSNNYLDNYRQDSMDLLLCNFVGYPSPTYRPLDLASYSSTFPVAIIMITLVALYVYFRHDSLRLLEN